MDISSLFELAKSHLPPLLFKLNNINRTQDFLRRRAQDFLRGYYSQFDSKIGFECSLKNLEAGFDVATMIKISAEVVEIVRKDLRNYIETLPQSERLAWAPVLHLFTLDLQEKYNVFWLEWDIKNSTIFPLKPIVLLIPRKWEKSSFCRKSKV